mmetsp:Transcript_8655/g.28513  ORF Transcript_8655/g.28513 Transcript_8655/m.28513 type:complete len:425 (+) Transcript_8655:104-1378(+)
MPVGQPKHAVGKAYRAPRGGVSSFRVEPRAMPVVVVELGEERRVARRAPVVHANVHAQDARAQQLHRGVVVEELVLASLDVDIQHVDGARQLVRADQLAQARRLQRRRRRVVRGARPVREAPVARVGLDVHLPPLLLPLAQLRTGGDESHMEVERVLRVAPVRVARCHVVQRRSERAHHVDAQEVRRGQLLVRGQARAESSECSPRPMAIPAAELDERERPLAALPTARLRGDVVVHGGEHVDVLKVLLGDHGPRSLQRRRAHGRVVPQARNELTRPSPMALLLGASTLTAMALLQWPQVSWQSSMPLVVCASEYLSQVRLCGAWVDPLWKRLFYALQLVAPIGNIALSVWQDTRVAEVSFWGAAASILMLSHAVDRSPVPLYMPARVRAAADLSQATGNAMIAWQLLATLPSLCVLWTAAQSL